MRINNPDKSKGGRPLFDGKNYDEVIRKLETAWALDCTDAEAASFADISKAALCEFLQKHPDVAERKSRLKEKPVLSARNALHKAINNGDATLALKYLERKRKDEFSTRQEFAPVEPTRYEFTPQQLAKIAMGENPTLVLSEHDHKQS